MYDDSQQEQKRLAELSADAACDIVGAVHDGRPLEAGLMFTEFYEENSHQPMAIMSLCTLIGFATSTEVLNNNQERMHHWADFLEILNIRACNEALKVKAQKTNEEDEFLRMMRDNFGH